MAVTGSDDLLSKNKEDLINEFADHLMKKRVKFPELGEVTMIEATFKFN